MERAKARKFHVIELSWHSHPSIQSIESEKLSCQRTERCGRHIEVERMMGIIGSSTNVSN
jgi:hypothetical protein